MEIKKYQPNKTLSVELSELLHRKYEKQKNFDFFKLT